MTGFIPYGRQTIEDDDVAAVAAALRDPYLTTGPRVPAFEAALAETAGASHAVACANGTAALHLAAMALELGPGDQVIVPTLTFLATANAPHLTGAEIVFADVDPASGLMTAETFEAALARAPRARAAFPVHLNGQICDTPALAAIAAARDVTLVEDACHALGATDPEGAPAGAARHAAMACFSFHPVKAIAMGEGGAVTTNDPALDARLRLLRNHGMSRAPESFPPGFADDAAAADGTPHPWIYAMNAPGLNYRVPDVLCALGLSQLGKLDRFIARRRAIAARYDAAFADLGSHAGPAGRRQRVAPAWHLYVLLVDFERAGVSRDALFASLRTRGVGAQVHYLPVHRQPYYRRLAPDLDLPGADAYYGRAVSLPIHPSMTDADADAVIDAVHAALGA